MDLDRSSITPASIAETVRQALDEARAMVDQIVADGDRPSWERTLAPLDAVRDLLARTEGTAGFMGYVHPDREVRAAGREAEEALSKFTVELRFREDLHAVVRRLAESGEGRSLEGERRRFLEHLLRDFRKAGHDLDPARRARLRELTDRLVELGVAFERNIAEHQDHLVVSPPDLEGLPDGYVDTLDPGPTPGTFRVTMAYPHVVPFLEHAHRRDLRRELSRKFASRAVDANRPILEEAVTIRREIAGLFEAPSWAHHQMDERMAKTPETVERFYRRLQGPLTAAAREEIARMARMLEADTGDTELQAYDWRYYDTRLRREEHGVDTAEVAAYFPLERVLEGLLDLTGEVLGLRFERIEAATWHHDVMSHRILDADSGEPLAVFHMDLFPREGKFSHAAAFTLVPGRRLPDGSYQAPVSAIVANVTKPTRDRPSLLQHDEVVTLFHEFGHVLHQTLTRTDLVAFSGTNTEQDFVEAPSQIMEHWVWQAEVLSRFARHHETGLPIPEDLVARLVEARRLNVAIAALRQMSFGYLDLRLHGPGEEKDLDRILADATALSLLPHQPDTFFPASFGHLFGYDAGYYGYLWSEVYGDDMFSRFEAEGLTNPEVGRAYRRAVLERGGSRDALELLRDFLGREPDDRAFLRKLGIGG